MAQINHANSAALFIPHPEPLYHASHLVQFDVEVPLLPLIKGCNLLLTRVGTFSNVLYTNSVVNKWNDSSSTVLLQARASSMTQILHSACEKIMLPFPHPSQTKFVAMESSRNKRHALHEPLLTPEDVLFPVPLTNSSHNATADLEREKRGGAVAVAGIVAIASSIGLGALIGSSATDTHAEVQVNSRAVTDLAHAIEQLNVVVIDKLQDLYKHNSVTEAKLTVVSLQLQVEAMASKVDMFNSFLAFALNHSIHPSLLHKDDLESAFQELKRIATKDGLELPMSSAEQLLAMPMTWTVDKERRKYTLHTVIPLSQLPPFQTSTYSDFPIVLSHVNKQTAAFTPAPREVTLAVVAHLPDRFRKSESSFSGPFYVALTEQDLRSCVKAAGFQFCLLNSITPSTHEHCLAALWAGNKSAVPKLCPLLQEHRPIVFRRLQGDKLLAFSRKDTSAVVSCPFDHNKSETLPLPAGLSTIYLEPNCSLTCQGAFVASVSHDHTTVIARLRAWDSDDFLSNLDISTQNLTQFLNAHPDDLSELRNIAIKLHSPTNIFKKIITGMKKQLNSLASWNPFAPFSTIMSFITVASVLFTIGFCCCQLRSCLAARRQRSYDYRHPNTPNPPPYPPNSASRQPESAPPSPRQLKRDVKTIRSAVQSLHNAILERR